MAIERPLEDGPLRLEIPEEEVKIDFPDIAPEITGDDDGGMLIDFLGGVPDDSGPEFSDNLAEFMED